MTDEHPAKVTKCSLIPGWLLFYLFFNSILTVRILEGSHNIEWVC